MGAGERLALALAELAQGVADDALGRSRRRPAVRRARADSIATRRRTCGGAATADSTARSMSAAASSRRPSWRFAPARSRSSSGSRSTDEPSRASRLSIDCGSIVSATDSRESTDHARRPLVAAGVEHQRDRLEGAAALRACRRPACRRRPGRRASPRSAAAAASSSVPVDLAPQRDAARRRPRGRTRRPPSRSSMRRVDAGRADEQGDDRARRRRSSWCSAVSLADAHEARGDGDGVGSRVAQRLVERRWR